MTIIRLSNNNSITDTAVSPFPICCQEIVQLPRDAVEEVVERSTWMPSWTLKTMGM